MTIPFYPSEHEGTGYHPEDIGPMHCYPMTKRDHDFYENVTRPMLQMWEDVVVPGLAMKTPLAELCENES